MSCPQEPPAASIEISLLGEAALRKHLHELGFTNAAIEEFFKGHSISATGVQEVFPGLTLPGEEKVFKDGKLQNVEYPERKPKPSGP